ncbi:MAG TPA: 4-(cytidine 5'-diphospho)-2-C-methyl-D-erythritol kinase [Rhodanobacteraceae bacterium]|jgi:4-diphosphocytidyl-2-C-methyl-D-erythritol kinase|nr:4-(cytidine 5'-diphospho)-2-C-methyl-D-erythritol kinase [Rhodanobacteraceae bacterium]
MTQSWTSWPAPAKLNLFLHIVGRRADGYHLLQTVFQLLDWGDTVRLRIRTDGQIARVNDVPGVPMEGDLCLRAAHALRERCGGRLGADIGLDKHIPLGGGLGGGSSDAATVLVALNDLWSAGLSPDQLAGIALELGADVPVFVRGYSAWAEGIGEKLTPIALREQHYVIVDPGVSVATSALFQAPELTRNSPPLTISDYLSGSGIATTNAFTSVVRAGYPPLAAAIDWLGQFGEARLTGTGGCVFVDAESAQRADEIARQCPAHFAAYRARGVNRSPLLDALEHNRRPT